LLYAFTTLALLSAPGTYKPEQVVQEHIPAFSFGLKTKHIQVSDTPGKDGLACLKAVNWL